MVKLGVDLCGIPLRNPVIPASGTFGFGTEMAAHVDLNALGGIALKGCTREPRYGNASPRIAECPGGMLNAVGLQNPGVEVVAGEKIPALRRVFDGVVIVNVSGFSIEEYVFCCRRVAPLADIVELNISCPNVHGGGMAFGTSPEMAAAVTAAAREACGKTPLFVKLSPNVTDIVAVARACEAAGADGLTLINTLLGMRIDIRTRRPVLANRYGGFSGPALLPLALRMVHQVHRACSLPIMGCGRVCSAHEAVEMMMAGASAVQVGAQNLRDPFACPRIVGDLPGLLDELGVMDINEIRGVA